MPTEPLEQLKALLPLWEQATPRPWESYVNRRYYGVRRQYGERLFGEDVAPGSRVSDNSPLLDDLSFVSAARNLDLPGIIAWAEGLQRENSELRAEVTCQQTEIVKLKRTNGLLAAELDTADSRAMEKCQREMARLRADVTRLKALADHLVAENARLTEAKPFINTTSTTGDAIA